MRITTDHDVIKQWAEKLQGRPDIIEDSQARNETIGIRINFPGKEDEAFFSKEKMPHHTSWKSFFMIFEEHGLAFEYEENPTGDPSYAYRFVSREIGEDEKI